MTRRLRQVMGYMRSVDYGIYIISVDRVLPGTTEGTGLYGAGGGSAKNFLACALESETFLLSYPIFLHPNSSQNVLSQNPLSRF